MLPSSNVTLPRFVALRNASAPMLTTLFGMVTLWMSEP